MREKLPRMKRKRIIAFFVTLVICLGVFAVFYFNGDKTGFSFYSSVVNGDDSKGYSKSCYLDTVYSETGAVTEYDGDTFYVLDRLDDTALAEVFCDTKEGDHVEKVAQIELDKDDPGVYGLSVNKDYVLLVTSKYITQVHRRTGLSKRIMSIEDFDNINICDDSIYYSDAEGYVYRTRIDTLRTERLDGVKSMLVAVYKNQMYYSDMDNGGKLSACLPDDKLIIRSDTAVLTGFRLDNGVLKMIYQNQ